MRRLLRHSVRRQWRSSALAIVTTLVFAAPAIPADGRCVGERPTYVEGEAWVYRRSGAPYILEFLRYDGGEMVERRTTRGTVRFLRSSRDGNPLRMLSEDGKVVEDYGGEIPRLQFPLRVGASWSGSYRTSEGVRRQMSARVIACEDIITAAGTFAAFKIAITNQRVDRNRPAYETLWYAPDVKRAVKHVSVELAIDTELTDYVRSGQR